MTIATIATASNIAVVHFDAASAAAARITAPSTPGSAASCFCLSRFQKLTVTSE
jgi:hypothetical protein